MSNIDPFRQACREQIQAHWKKTFNPFDKERPRVAKYPAAITDHAEAELDGVPHIFRIRIEDCGTAEDFRKRAEAVCSPPNHPMPVEMVAELQKIDADFMRDMAAGNFVK